MWLKSLCNYFVILIYFLPLQVSVFIAMYLSLILSVYIATDRYIFLKPQHMEGRLHVLWQQQHSSATQQPQQRSATAPWTSLADSGRSYQSPPTASGTLGTLHVKVTGPPERLRQAYSLAVHLLGGTVPASAALPAGFAHQHQPQHQHHQAAPPAP